MIENLLSRCNMSLAFEIKSTWVDELVFICNIMLTTRIPGFSLRITSNLLREE